MADPKSVPHRINTKQTRTQDDIITQATATAAQDSDEENLDVTENEYERIERRLNEDKKRTEKLMEIMSEEQMERYSAMRRSVINKNGIKKIMQSTLVGPISPSVLMVVSGITKVFVGELVEKAREVQRKWKEAESEDRHEKLHLKRYIQQMDQDRLHEMQETSAQVQNDVSVAYAGSVDQSQIEDISVREPSFSELRSHAAEASEIGITAANRKESFRTVEEFDQEATDMLLFGGYEDSLAPSDEDSDDIEPPEALLPEHIREAHRLLKLEGKVPIPKRGHTIDLDFF